MEATQVRTRQPERAGERHKAVAFERGMSGDQGQLKGYVASCGSCSAVTFGGFRTKTEAKSALMHHEVDRLGQWVAK
jgi:hypothetical protein